MAPSSVVWVVAVGLVGAAACASTTGGTREPDAGSDAGGDASVGADAAGDAGGECRLPAIVAEALQRPYTGPDGGAACRDDLVGFNDCASGEHELVCWGNAGPGDAGPVCRLVPHPGASAGSLLCCPCGP